MKHSVESSRWRLSGHYPFSSGCDFAQWAIIGAFLGEKGDPSGVAYRLVALAEAEALRARRDMVYAQH
jgi:hypothetical protein